MAFTKASHDSQIYECSMMEIKKYMNKGDLFDVGFEGSQTDLKNVSPQRFLKKKKKKVIWRGLSGLSWSNN